MAGRVDVKRRSCVLFFSLFVSHIDVFPRNPSFLRSFLPPSVFLCLSLSIRLTVSHPSSLRLDQQQRRRVKSFSSSCSPSALSAPVLLITHLFPFHPSQLTSVLVCASPLSIVHHGTALTQTKPQVIYQVLN